MNKTVSKLGRFCSVFSLCTFIGYTLCFAAILIANPPFTWSNTTAFIQYSMTYSQLFKYAAMVMMILFGISFTIQTECLQVFAEGIGRFWAKLAAKFTLAFALLIGISYFVQISAVRLQIEAGQTEGIGQLVQSNPISFIASVNMLGWTLFFGLACLFTGLSVKKTTLASKVLKISLFANAAMMLICSVAYVLNITIILMLFMYAGLGAAIVVACAAMTRYFRQRADTPVIEKN